MFTISGTGFLKMFPFFNLKKLKDKNTEKRLNFLQKSRSTRTASVIGWIHLSLEKLGE
jgi:hypothetical protein